MKDLVTLEESTPGNNSLVSPLTLTLCHLGNGLGIAVQEREGTRHAAVEGSDEGPQKQGSSLASVGKRIEGASGPELATTPPVSNNPVCSCLMRPGFPLRGWNTHCSQPWGVDGVIQGRLCPPAPLLPASSLTCRPLPGTESESCLELTLSP